MNVDKFKDIEQDIEKPKFLHLLHPSKEYMMYQEGKGGDSNNKLLPGASMHDEKVVKVGFDVVSMRSSRMRQYEDAVSKKEYIAKNKTGGELGKEAERNKPSRRRGMARDYLENAIVRIQGFVDAEGNELSADNPGDIRKATGGEGDGFEWLLDQIDEFIAQDNHFLDYNSSATN